jgi:hypothetical protein
MEGRFRHRQPRSSHSLEQFHRYCGPLLGLKGYRFTMVSRQGTTSVVPSVELKNLGFSP